MSKNVKLIQYKLNILGTTVLDFLEHIVIIKEIWKFQMLTSITLEGSLEVNLAGQVVKDVLKVEVPIKAKESQEEALFISSSLSSTIKVIISSKKIN